ncbi:MAG: hypothetical protein JXA49_03080 [Actinobacteria bacterium]|nr:hypothetical protein [Actinomycetota bacterium]
MPIDPEALVKLVQAAERSGIAEQMGIIMGDVMMRIVNEPNVDYEKFFETMAGQMTAARMEKSFKLMKSMGRFSSLLNPLMKIAANDFVMMMVAIPVSIPFVQRVTVNLTSKVAILVLKGKMPRLIPKFKKATA